MGHKSWVPLQYLQGIVAGSAAMRFCRQSGGDALRLVMAENMGPWLRAFSASRRKVVGDREKFADAWRRWVEEQFPVGGMLHLLQPPSVPPVGPAAPPAAAAKPAPKAAPKPPPKRSPPPQYGSYANIRYVLQHFGSDLATEQRGAKAINVCPGVGLMGLVTARGKPASTAGPPTSTPRTCWTTSSGTMRLIRHNGTRRWPCWPALCREARQGPRIGPGEVQSAHAAQGAHPAEGRGASQSAAQPGAIGSASHRGAMTSTGSAAASTFGGEAEGGPAASAGSKPAAAASGGDPRGQGPSRQPPAPGAGGPPPPNDPGRRRTGRTGGR